MSARVYSRLTVASVPSTDTRLVTELAQAGLIAGTVPTNGTANFLRNSGEHDGRSGVAGDDDEIWPLLRDEFVHQCDDARNQRRLRQRPIGERRIVGDIEKIGIADAPPRPHDRR